MTHKVRAYENWGHQYWDEISEWCVDQALRCIAVGLLISAPMALHGAVTAPEGVHRADSAMNSILIGHGFLWHHGLNFTGKVLSTVWELGDNGSSSNE